jgi:hypothetical protein
MLWVSDLGKNPFSTVRRLLTGELEAFDFATLTKMEAGKALEVNTIHYVMQGLGRRVTLQFPLFDDIWTGYGDFVIDHGTPEAIIADHKASAGRWWDYRESLPRATDMCQVWLYGQLYEHLYGLEPALRLYYRGWGTWAAFEITVAESPDILNCMVATGQITDEKGAEVNNVIRTRQVNPTWLKNELEEYHSRVFDGEISEAEMVALDPGGPDWDYAENACVRLAPKYLSGGGPF